MRIEPLVFSISEIRKAIMTMVFKFQKLNPSPRIKKREKYLFKNMKWFLMNDFKMRSSFEFISKRKSQAPLFCHCFFWNFCASGIFVVFTISSGTRPARVRDKLHRISPLEGVLLAYQNKWNNFIKPNKY